MNGCAYLTAAGYAPVISWVLNFNISFVFPCRILCFWTCALFIETLVSRKIKLLCRVFIYSDLCCYNTPFRSSASSSVVFLAAVTKVVTQRSVSGKERCVTTLITEVLLQIDLIIRLRRKLVVPRQHISFIFVPELKDAFEVLSVGKESYVFRASTSREYRRWLKYLRLESKELGAWKRRRNGLPNIMIKNL